MKKLYIYFIMFVIAPLTIHAQTLDDAVRYSTMVPGGTARTIGAGGAFGALGGDFGSIGINPAGLGIYRSSEFVVSPGILNRKTESILSGENFSTITDEGYLGLENVGLVINKNPIASTWTTSNFSIGYAKVANFNRDYSFLGSSLGSITERWVELADGFPSGDLDFFETQPAFIAGAIFDFDEDNFYNTDLDQFRDTPIRKEQIIEERGGISELSLNWAGNYQNKLSVGLGVGIPFLSFRQNKDYFEDDPNDEIPVFNELQYREFVNTTGTGVNLKAGLIYTPSRSLRLGLAVHTPTYYFLTDDFFTEITYDFTDSNGNQRFTEGSPDGNFQYRFTTPWRAIGSIATLYKVGDIQGFISADVEYRDYSQGSFDLENEGEFQRSLNNDIEDLTTSATIIRLGTELAYKKVRLRGGIQLEQSPYTFDDGLTDNRYSFGIGYRENKFFLDLGVSVFNTGELYYPYISSDINRDPLVDSDITTSNLVATAGFKF